MDILGLQALLHHRISRARIPSQDQLPTSKVYMRPFSSDICGGLTQSIAIWAVEHLRIVCAYISLPSSQIQRARLSCTPECPPYFTVIIPLFPSPHVHDIGFWYLPLGTCRWIRCHNSTCFSIADQHPHQQLSQHLDSMPGRTCLVHSHH